MISQLHYTSQQCLPTLGSKTNPEELSKCRIVWLARLSLDEFLGLLALPLLVCGFEQPYQVFSEPETNNFKHATEFIFGLANAGTSQQLQRAEHENAPTSQTSLVGRYSANILPVVSLILGNEFWLLPPKLGIGSSNCAGSEKRTLAMSATPMNLAQHVLALYLCLPLSSVAVLLVPTTKKVRTSSEC